MIGLRNGRHELGFCTKVCLHRGVRCIINMRNTYARFPTVSRDVATFPKTRTILTRFISAIHFTSDIHLILKKSPGRKQTPVKPKKSRKNNEGRTRAVPDNKEEEVIETSHEEASPISKDTITLHFIKFMNKLLDIKDLDPNFKGNYLFLGKTSNFIWTVMTRSMLSSRGHSILRFGVFTHIQGRM
jgi:hypothetical protein